MNHKQKKAIRWMLLILLAVVLAVAGAFLYQHFTEDREKKSDTEALSQAGNNTVYYNGEAYVYNSNLKNILFLGIDYDEEVVLQDAVGEGGQAEYIMILSIDIENESLRILQISPNAMTDIDVYDKNGNYDTSMEAQLSTQYAYGNGADTSCWAMKRTVSELLGDLPISGYFALDMEAVSLINDMLEENDLRIQEEQNIPALFRAMLKLLEKSDESLGSMIEKISSYVVTDLTADDVKAMIKAEWNMEEILYVPGESVNGEIYEEFYVDEEELQEILIKNFYRLK